jgi:hypothetical protein
LLNIIANSGKLYRFTTRNYDEAVPRNAGHAANYLICLLPADGMKPALDVMTAQWLRGIFQLPTQEKMPNTKTTFARLVIAAVCAVPAIAITAGCSSTPSHESAGEYTNDTALTTKVKTALLEDPGLKSLSVSVKTYRSEVLLSGFVDSPNQIQKAVSVARGVEGVQSVKNDLHVKPQ